MAAVEEPAGPTGMESLSLETDDMKNTARKSTTKPAQLSERVSSTSPSPIANGNMESPGDKHSVTNGNGTHKRSVDQEDTGNPAKIARLHIEEMEKAQEEMTRKVSREEDNRVVAQNGDAVREDSSHSQGDKSNDSNNSKQSSLSQHSRSSLALSADARNNFKGILDSAMAKVGPQRNSLNGPESSTNDSQPNSVPSEDKLDQSMAVDKTQEENGNSKQEDAHSSQPDGETSDLKPVDISSDSQGVSDAEEGTSEDTKSKDLTSAEKETEQVESEFSDLKEITEDCKLTSDDTEEVTSKDDDVAKATSKDDDVAKATLKDDDVVKATSKADDVAKATSKDNDVAKATSKVNDVAKATSKDDDVTKATSDSRPLNDDALLEEDGPEEDQAGDVDDAVLLSDDDKCDDKSPSDKVTKKSIDKPDETQGDKIADKSCDEKSKDESDSDKCTGSSEQNSKEAPDVAASPSVADKEEDKTDKDTETSQSEGDKDNATKDSSVEKDTSDSTEEKPTSDSNTEAAKESSEGKTKKAKCFDIPEDKIISLSDDDGEEEKAQSDSKSETKMDLNPDDPIEIEDEDDEDDDKKSEASDVSLRKRGATSPIPSESSSTTKKSRLDKVIGRIGSSVGIKPDENAPIDVDDIKDKAEEKAAESTEEKMDVEKVVIKDVTNEGASEDKKDSNTEGDVKPDIKPDVDSKIAKTPSLSGGKKNITLTAEELNELLVKRMNAYLERSRGSLVVQLQTRISELQQAVESWRAQAKRLAKQLDEEVAKSSQRRQGKMAKQSRPNQLQAATMQQQQGGAGGKVTIRGTPPRPTPQGIPTNVNAVPMRLSPAQVAAAQAKGTTVRDLLDKQRLNDPVGAKNQSVQIQGGRILVSGAQIGVRNGSLVSAGGPRPGTVVRTVHPPVTSPGGVGKSVIDLTDDDGGTGNTPTKIVRTAAGQQVAVRALGPAGSAARPGTVLVQQVPNSGGGPVLVQQVATSQTLRTAGGTTYVYTSRPGTTLGVQTAPGTSLVRPAQMTTAAPPALRPAATQLVTLSRAGPGTNTLTRPPPPLRSAPTVNNTQVKHPAPLPPIPDTQPTHPKRPPPKPGLKISRVQSGIVLSWNMAVSEQAAQISSYQLFAYQETAAPPATSLWKKVGDVKALPLPMACTLTQFQEGNKYHFAVRAVDVHNRVGPFSEPSSIALTAINVS